MKDSVTLVIDTSTDACTVAVSAFNRVAERSSRGSRQHAEKVLPMVQEVLAELMVSVSDVEVIGVTRGPGAFTGVRLGVCVAQGLAFATGAKLYAISTLASIAQTAADKYRRDWVIASIDARMDEIYAAAFARSPDGRMLAVSEEVVCLPDQLNARLGNLPAKGWLGAGSGWCYEEHLRMQFVCVEQVDPEVLPGYGALMSLVEGACLNTAPLDPAALQPVYLRNNVADPSAKVTQSFDITTFLASL